VFATFDDRSTRDKHRKNTFLRQAASTSAKFDNWGRRRLEKRRLRTGNWVHKETAPTKSPPREWRQIAMDLFQVNNCDPGHTVVKGTISRKTLALTGVTKPLLKVN